MINVSAAWMQSLYNDHRNYLVHLKITLQDNTVLNLTNENIWGGSLSVDDAVSSDNEFQIGAAIINKMSVTINNIYGDYDPYDFYGARVELKIGLIIDGEEEKINKGKYIVNNATYNGQLIALECYDYMYFFDVSYSTSNQIFPATIDDIVRNCCTDVGVSLNTYDFPHKNYSITTPPEKEKTTYREIISWCAQICGCFARCNTNGQLEFKWYDFDTLDQTAHSFLNGGIFDEDTPYSTGNTADGGKFNPWNLGDVYDGGAFNWNTTVHTITSLYSLNVSVDDVIITRIQAIVKAEDTQNQAESEKAYNIGTAGYTVEIRNNPFITESNVDEILSWLGTQIIGVKFRKASISHASDPSIEAGDSAVVIDRKNTIYPIIISRTTFSTGGSQNSISAAQNPLRNSAARFSAETKNYVDLRQRIQNERTTRQQIEAQLALDIANSNGMYKTETTEGGATKYYLHNKPQLSDSAIRILFSDVGITVTANGLDANPTWYGLRVNGDLISRILTATGVNADWIDTGALVVRDNKNNLVFKADISNHTVYVKGYATFSDLSGNGTTTINGANIKTGTISAARLELTDYAKFTDLSGNGTTTINGANIKTGTISAARLELTDYAKFTDLSGNGTTTINGSNITTGTINADLIKAGTLQSQDSARYPNFSINLSDGTITIKHGSINLGNNNFIVDDNGNVTIKKGSITIGTNENFKVLSDGSVTMKNATITGYLKPSDVGDSGSTTISGNRITTGTVAAARLDLSGVASITSLKNGTTTINGGCITTGVIQDSTSYPNFKIDFINKRIDIKQGEINLGNGNFVAYNNGSVTMKNATITGYLKPDDVGDNGNTTISGNRIKTGTIDAKYLNLSGCLTANDVGDNGNTKISGSRITTGSINADLITAGTLKSKGASPNFSLNLSTGELTMKNGSINLGNKFIVDKDGNVTMKGTVTINGASGSSGYVTDTSLSNSLSAYPTKTALKTSKATEISGDNISTGRIEAKYLDLTGTLTADDLGKNGKTVISGSRISTGTIKSSNENVVFNLDNGSLKMNSGSININKNFIVDEKGNATFKGTVTISGSPSISGYVSESSLSNSLSGYATKEGLKNSGYTSIHGGNLVNFSISTYKIAAEAITAEKIKTGTITANQIASKTITAGEISTGTITAKEIQSNISLAGTFKAVSSSSITTLEDGVLYTKDSNNNKYGRLQYTSLFAGSSTVALQTWYTSGTLYLSCGINGTKYISIDNGGIEMSGFSCNCSKSRIVKTEEYDTRALYCYETPSPMFGDLGEGTISDDGFCYVQIDPVFSRTVALDDYKVFLQKYGEGDCYVFEKKSYCFIVKGTPNLIFDWEIKAKQFDCEQKRLDIYTVKINSPNNIVDYNIDGEDKINTEIKNTTYAEDAQEHIEELYKERTT